MIFDEKLLKKGLEKKDRSYLKEVYDYEARKRSRKRNRKIKPLLIIDVLV